MRKERHRKRKTFAEWDRIRSTPPDKMTRRERRHWRAGEDQLLKELLRGSCASGEAK